MRYDLIKYCPVLVSILMCCASLSAQFEGGVSDGFDRSGILQHTLNGQQINTISLYLGGRGDGHDKEDFNGIMDGTSLDGLYAGGPGDGHDKEDFNGIMDGTSLDGLFTGGPGDGHDKEDFNGIMDGTSLDGLYTGGAGDGHDKSDFFGVMDGVELSMLYTGGPGDGHDKELVASLLDGMRLDILYGGGDGDGHDKYGLSSVMDGTSLARLYAGGPGDGFDKQSIEYIFTFPGCTFVVNTNDDGFGSMRYAIDCAMPGDTIVFSPLFLNDTIALTSSEIAIDKDLHVLYNPTKNLFVDASAIERAFNIAIGQNVVIGGLKIIAGTSATGSGLLNKGMLTLIEVTLTGGNSGNPVLMATGTAATTTLRGTIVIQ